MASRARPGAASSGHRWSSRRAGRAWFYSQQHANGHHALASAGLGGAPPPKTDLHRFVKWPKYVRLQRQKRVLSMRLKVPPQVNQFMTKALDKNQAETLFKMLLKYRPEDKKQKKDRCDARAFDSAAALPAALANDGSELDGRSFGLARAHHTALCRMKRSNVLLPAKRMLVRRCDAGDAPWMCRGEARDVHALTACTHCIMAQAEG